MHVHKKDMIEGEATSNISFKGLLPTLEQLDALVLSVTICRREIIVNGSKEPLEQR